MTCLECPSIHCSELEQRLEAMASHVDLVAALCARQAKAIEALEAALMKWSQLDRATLHAKGAGDAPP